MLEADIVQRQERIPRPRQRIRRKFIALAVLSTLLLFTAGIGAYLYLDRGPSVMFTSEQRASVPFDALYPVSGDMFTPREQAFQYTSSERLLVMSLQFTPGRTRLVLSEQPAPSDMTETDFTNLVSTMNQYGNFVGPQGRVYLTRPSQQGGKQTAVLLTEKVLLFARADDDLGDDLWRQVFENLIEQ